MSVISDRELGLRLANYIHTFDEGVFPARPAKLSWLPDKPEFKRTNAAYSKKVDIYAVRLNGSRETFLTCAHLSVLTFMAGKLNKPGLEMSIEEALIGIAAHEARHRVQFKTNVDLIESGPTKDKENPDFLEMCAGIMDSWIVHSKILEGEKPWHRSFEYDAQVIGLLTASLWKYDNRSLQRLAAIISADSWEIPALLQYCVPEP